MVQGKTFAGWLARTFPAYRDRLIEDPRFFFKVGSGIFFDLKAAQGRDQRSSMEGASPSRHQAHARHAHRDRRGP